MKKTILVVALLLTTCALSAAEKWTLGKPHLWTRKGEAKLSANEGRFKMSFSTELDWACHGIGRVEVKPGDSFKLQLRVKAGFEKNASAVSCVTLYDSENKALAWTYCSTPFASGTMWQDIVSEFIVPNGVAVIEPRIVGDKSAELELESFVLERTGAVEMVQFDPVVLENGFIQLTIDPCSNLLAVKELRNGKAWEQVADFGSLFTKGVSVAVDKKSAVLELVYGETMLEFSATLKLAQEAAEFVVVLNGKGEFFSPILYPAAFRTHPGERLIVPMNEGISYPVDEDNQGLHSMIAYGGHGICMSFFGCMREVDGSGWMCILETPDDASMNAFRGGDGFWRISPRWETSKGKFSYERRIRYVFFDKGGHVAMCKRYRQHAKESGLFKPFTEKVKERPAIDLLIGAANIWNWDAASRKVELVKELQAAGIDRILWSGSGTGAEIAEMNKLKGVLTGRYDIYQDIMDPARYDEVVWVHSDWVPEAFPHDVNHAAPGVLRRGWQVNRKDGRGRIACVVICDSKALPYARKRISSDLKDKPFKARFIDTTVAAPWFECWHPDHPMNRTQSKQWKMKLLDLVSSEFGLVCGSETGHDASVPFCDYFEGMLSLGSYRVHEAGRNMMRKVDQVPPQISRYQVGEKYRLPLWELVYHDCVVAQWYWGDYNNKLPKIWRRRDLFNALYGSPPMYMFTLQEWRENKLKFIESYKVAQPVSRATGYSEMVDHKILSADRSVQQTRFANGVEVTVNFGSASYKMADGHEIKPLDLHLEGM